MTNPQDSYSSNLNATSSTSGSVPEPMPSTESEQMVSLFSDLTPQPGYPSQLGYPPQHGYPVQPGYPSQPGYPPQPGYQTYPLPGGPGCRGATDPKDMSLPLYNASFGQSVIRFFRGFVRFKGRASRREYWWVQLFLFLILIVPIAVVVIVIFQSLSSLSTNDLIEISSNRTTLMGWVFRTPSVAFAFFATLACSLALSLGSLALNWRRLQDANIPGAWTFVSLVLYLLGFVPVLGTLTSFCATAWWIVVGALPTKPEGQRFDKP